MFYPNHRLEASRAELIQMHSTLQAIDAQRLKDMERTEKDRERSREYQRRGKDSHPGLHLLRRLIARAKRKGIECVLTVEQCEVLGGCHYCGEPATGFDRIDSDGGYTLKNTVPACSECNSMKWAVSQDDFITRCKLIASRF
jgi:hypothetical protein